MQDMEDGKTKLYNNDGDKYVSLDDMELKDALKVMDACLEATSSADAELRASLNHYPHIRITGPKVLIWNTAEEYSCDNSREKMLTRGVRTQTKGWKSSRWNTRMLVQRSETTMHFAVSFIRMNAEGKDLAIFDSLWILTKKEGRWGVQARSSFAGDV